MTTFRENDCPLVIAHRGASRDYAENTLAAFRGALAQGADWVELDVRRGDDGALLVRHDPFEPGQSVGAAVPTLAAALAASEHLGVNVEIKNLEGEYGFDPSRGIADEVASVIAASGRPGTAPVLVSSFDLRTIDRAHAAAPELATGLLTGGLEPARVARVIEVVAGRGHASLHPHEQCVDAALVDRAHGAGLAVHVWTVDDPDRIKELAALGVDGIITNVPALARTTLGGR